MSTAPATTSEQTAPVSDADLLTVQEAANLLRVKVSWIYARVEGVNDLPVMRVGRYLRFRRGVLNRWLDNGGSEKP